MYWSGYLIVNGISVKKLMQATTENKMKIMKIKTVQRNYELERVMNFGAGMINSGDGKAKISK